VVRGGRVVLDCVDLLVEPGAVVGVIGPNGAGKTTLLRAALGLQPLASGVSRLSGRFIESLSPSEKARLVGYLPQERRLAWNVAAWRAASLGAPDLPPRRAKGVALEALERVGLRDLAERGVFDMSGGERARVLLARLFATRAPLLVADEPAAGLDPEAQLLILELLKEHAAHGGAVVVTLHDLTLAARYCDWLVVLLDGRTSAEGSPSHALSGETLRRVFGLDGGIFETDAGPVIAARRPEPVS
jgi:iron complex transport system ATP-binding protein